jgi:hypothetical protein
MVLLDMSFMLVMPVSPFAWVRGWVDEGQLSAASVGCVSDFLSVVL